ncbi:P-loop containing nucleoside triphosphate hydrolase protein, partial [Sarocladium strictum]
PAILAGAGVTIIVAPFAKLKRQLVSRCADAGLECYPFVFLTGTLPPLRQREFKEAIQLQNPLYIRALSHRLNVQYSVVRVKNSRGIAKVKKLVLSHRQDLAKGEKGVVYCASHAKCKALAQQLGCHYYHGLPSDSNAHFFAQRKEGFQAWLEGTTPYIVATAALGTGIDVPGIKHIIHLEAPYSIIDYAQEAGRAGRAGERVQAEVIVKDKDWPSEDASKDGYLEVKVREVNSLVRTRGCRRRLLRQYLDSDLRDCKALEAVMCDNYEQESRVWKSKLSSQGLIMSQSYSRRAAWALQQLESALKKIKELGKPGCRVNKSLSFRHYIMFQGKINYRKDKQARFLSCFYCHVSQSLYTKGFKSKGASCRWKHIVMLVALAAATKESLWEQVQQLAGREFKGEEDFCGWLGRKHAKLVCSKEMTNAIAVFNLVVE